MSSNMHLILIQSPEFMYQFQCKAENQSFVFCKHRYRLPQTQIGTSLLVQWLTFYIPRAGGPSRIPRQGTRSCVPELRPGTAKQILKIERERDKSISITLVFKKKKFPTNSLYFLILCSIQLLGYHSSPKYLRVQSFLIVASHYYPDLWSKNQILHAATKSLHTTTKNEDPTCHN